MSHKFNNETLLWLYKYRQLDDKSIEWTSRVVTHGELWFAAAPTFEDENELRPTYQFVGSDIQVRNYCEQFCSRHWPQVEGDPRARLIAEMQARIAEANAKYGGAPSPQATEFMSTEILKVGICCFGESWASTAMWSKYAQDHTGVCLRFKAKSTTPFFGAAQRVFYRDELPVVNPFTQAMQERVERFALWKAMKWRFEQEWRIIDTDNGPGIRTYPAELLDTIILGARISPEHEQIVRRLADEANPKVAVRKAVLSPDGSRVLLA